GVVPCPRRALGSPRSLTSMRPSAHVAPSSAGALTRAIRPRSSEPLLVLRPSAPRRSTSTAPVAASRTTAPYPAGPGLPREPPSASTTTLIALTAPYAPECAGSSRTARCHQRRLHGRRSARCRPAPDGSPRSAVAAAWPHLHR